MGTFKIAKTVLKSLFNKPETLMYPVEQREWQERTRGSVQIDTDKCILCGICSRRCPTGALDAEKKDGVWEIFRMQCIQCGACVEVCPTQCLTMDPQYTQPGEEKFSDVYEIPKFQKIDAEVLAMEMEEPLICDRESCVFCGLCAKVCPAEALTVDRKEKLWEVNEEECVKCGICTEKCPKKCLGFGESPAAEESADQAAEKPAKQKPAAKETAAAAETRDDLHCNLEECIFCGLCAKNCPCDALEVDREAKTWKVNEEECVRCGACVNKCPKHCLSLGEQAKEEPEERDVQTSEELEKLAEKPIPAVDPEKCIYCRLCENTCPSEAIQVEVDHWVLDEEKCISCGVCLEACPADALLMENDRSI